jgi:hypothetical protein
MHSIVLELGETTVRLTVSSAELYNFNKVKISIYEYVYNIMYQ